MSQYRLTQGSCIQGNVHCLFLVRRHIQTQYAPHKIRRKNCLEKPFACFGKSSEQTSHRPSDATIKTLAEFCEFRPAQRPQEPPAPCAFDPGWLVSHPARWISHMASSPPSKANECSKTFLTRNTLFTCTSKWCVALDQLFVLLRSSFFSDTVYCALLAVFASFPRSLLVFRFTLGFLSLLATEGSGVLQSLRRFSPCFPLVKVTPADEGCPQRLASAAS